MVRGSRAGAVAVVVAALTPLVLFFSALPLARASALREPDAGRRERAVIDVATPPVAAPPQPGVTTTTTTVGLPDLSDFSPGWEQRWGQAALARISYPWRQLGYSVVFLPGEPGLLGKTIPSSHTIQIFVRQGETFDRMSHALAHELGHAVDLTYNNAGRRAQWRQLRGIDESLPWFLWGGRDYASPAGDFAETFAYWQAGPSDYSDFGPPKDLAALVPFFSPSP